ncbi:MAG: hypothetical protein V2A62_05415 [Candidatus Woesearchaeota archaeon]
MTFINDWYHKLRSNLPVLCLVGYFGLGTGIVTLNEHFKVESKDHTPQGTLYTNTDGTRSLHPSINDMLDDKGARIIDLDGDGIPDKFFRQVAGPRIGWFNYERAPTPEETRRFQDALAYASKS